MNSTFSCQKTPFCHTLAQLYIYENKYFHCHYLTELNGHYTAKKACTNSWGIILEPIFYVCQNDFCIQKLMM